MLDAACVTVMNSSTLAPPTARTFASQNQVLVWLLSFAAFYSQTYVSLFHGAWSTDDQGHGPMVVGAAAYLLWIRRFEIFDGPAEPRPALGLATLMLSLVMFVIGHSQNVIEFEAGSQIPALAAGILLVHGSKALRKAWFPLFFLLFSMPLPPALTQMITMPLKLLVSYVAENVLYWLGYPIGRIGVSLAVGNYKLLVADACSGLNSLFTLESLGLLYMNVMNYTSRSRNVILALMIIPISFMSNVTRVITLVLLTYYFGDEVGQGFAHKFSGMVLFSVALVLTYGFDRLLAARFDKEEGRRGHR